METKAIRVSNGERMRKKGNQDRGIIKGSRHDYYQNFYGRTSHHHKSRYCEKFGYEETAFMHPVLKQLRDSFDAKLQICYPKLFARELGRADKYERAMVTGFKPKKNPVLNLFQKLNKKLVEPVLKEAMECLKEPKRKNTPPFYDYY